MERASGQMLDLAVELGFAGLARVAMEYFNAGVGPYFSRRHDFGLAWAI
jgi:hypothetical protein